MLRQRCRECTMIQRGVHGPMKRSTQRWTQGWFRKWCNRPGWQRQGSDTCTHFQFFFLSSSVNHRTWTSSQLRYISHSRWKRWTQRVIYLIHNDVKDFQHSNWTRRSIRIQQVRWKYMSVERRYWVQWCKKCLQNYDLLHLKRECNFLPFSNLQHWQSLNDETIAYGNHKNSSSPALFFNYLYKSVTGWFNYNRLLLVLNILLSVLYGCMFSN